MYCVRIQPTDAELESLLASDAVAENPHDVYRALRERAPVYWSPTFNQWYVSTFELVDQVLTTPDVFSSVGAERRHLALLDERTRSKSPVLCGHFAAPQMNIADPPDHTRIRRGFNRLFLPRRVAGLRTRVDEIARELVAAALADRRTPSAGIASDGIDVLADVAGPLPVAVIAELMGVDPGLAGRIREVTMCQRHFFGTLPPDPDDAAVFERSIDEWRHVLRSTMADRLMEPRDCVMTATADLVASGVITEDEALATCLHLLIAGNSTTTALIGNTLYLLLRHRDQFDLVANNRELIPQAVEESLRFEPPLPGDRRIAVADYELAGQQIKTGDRVVSLLAAAARDPDQFDAPDVFDITRKFSIRQQTAFGRGIHMCIGAPVARLEAAITIEVVLDLMPHAELAADFEPRWHEVRTHRCLTELPIISRPSGSMPGEVA